MAGQDYQLRSIRLGSAVKSGVEHDELLINYADAVVSANQETLERARRELVNAVGPAALVDTAGVVASFNSIVRIADASGIELDSFKLEQTTSLRADLHLDDWAEI